MEPLKILGSWDESLQLGMLRFENPDVVSRDIILSNNVYIIITAQVPTKIDDSTGTLFLCKSDPVCLIRSKSALDRLFEGVKVYNDSLVNHKSCKSRHIELAAQLKVEIEVAIGARLRKIEERLDVIDKLHQIKREV